MSVTSRWIEPGCRETDAKGQTLKYARDSYGRVLTVSLAGSPDTVLRSGMSAAPGGITQDGLNFLPG